MFRERKSKRKRKRKKKRKRFDPRNKGKQMEITAQQLSKYQGTDPPNLIDGTVNGRVFDVATGNSFYGPDGSAAKFVGKDTSGAPAQTSKIDGLTESAIGVLTERENTKIHRIRKSFVFSVKVAIFCSSVMADLPNQHLPHQYMQRSAHALANSEAEVEEELLQRMKQQREEWVEFEDLKARVLVRNTPLVVDGEGRLVPPTP